MHHAAHTGCSAGARQLLRQLHMGALERRLSAMQDGHQVHHRVVARHQPRQRGLVVHVAFHRAAAAAA
jgi:2-methylcitrate dehydratase PrpD